MNILLIGSLVVSEHFEGTGKIVSVNIDSNFATVAFLSLLRNLMHVKLK
jgi:ATP-dependent helicase HepA